MQIAFDAKRAFHNGTGLGHYSRTLLESLARHYPEHQYWLLNPTPSDRFVLKGPQIHEIQPTHFLHRKLSSVWRSRWCKEWLIKNKIELYHGLSHELPYGLDPQKIATVVTMHDLIPERYPHQYSWADRRIYQQKFRYACKKANHIIAISEQTKRDLMQFYRIHEQKISVCYQSCDHRFYLPVSESEKARIRKKYQLPDRYFLSVGSIIERKNLLQVCRALKLLPPELTIPLVVIGSGGSYKKKVQTYLAQQGLTRRVFFLSDHPFHKSDPDFARALDFPAIYQMATALIYPSYFEGFGIPVLEALCSKIPVITSTVSCLPEAGGPGAFYIDPGHADSIAEAMLAVSTETDAVKKKIELGWQHAQHFTTDRTAAAVMKVYQELSD